MAGFLKAAAIRDIPAGQGKMVRVGGKSIALFNSKGTTMQLTTPAPTGVARCRTARSREPGDLPLARRNFRCCHR